MSLWCIVVSLLRIIFRDLQISFRREAIVDCNVWIVKYNVTVWYKVTLGVHLQVSFLILIWLFSQNNLTQVQLCWFSTPFCLILPCLGISALLLMTENVNRGFRPQEIDTSFWIIKSEYWFINVFLLFNQKCSLTSSETELR